MNIKKEFKIDLNQINVDIPSSIADEYISKVTTRIIELASGFLDHYIQEHKPERFSKEDFVTLLEYSQGEPSLDPKSLENFSVNISIKRPNGMSDEGFEEYKKRLFGL